VTLKLDADSIYVGLDSTTLSWTATNATSCEATDEWSGSQATSGSKVIRSDTARTLTFTLRCTGSGGSVTQSASLSAKLLTHTTCKNEHAEFFWNNPTKYFVPVRMREFLPVNSNGLLDQDSTIVGCMSATMRSPGVISGAWNWGLRSAGFPSIGYGSYWKWQPGQSTTTVIPIQVGQIPDSLIVSFDVDVNATGKVNTLIDMNVTSALAMDGCHYTEVMVITYVQGALETSWRNDTRVVPSLRAGDHTYRVPPYGTRRPSLYCPNDPTSGEQLIQVQVLGSLDRTDLGLFTKGSVPLKPIFDFLVRQGAFASTDYLQLIYFGTEMYGDGQGTTKLNSYSIRSR
jgi:hypothetical protein